MKRTTILFAFLCLAMAVNAQTAQQADSLHQRGRELVNEGKIAEGRECNRQAMEIRKTLLGEVSEDYINSLNNYALTFALEKDYPKAIQLQQQVMDLCGKLKQPHKNLGLYTTNMGRFYYLSGDKTRAAQMWEQALPLVEKHGEIYEFLLNSLGAYYTDAGDQQGISRIMALTEEHNQHELTKPCDEPKCMLERAKYFVSVGNTAQAKEHFLRLFEMPMSEAMKVDAYYEYATFLHGNHDNTAAAESARMAVQALLTTAGKTERYAHLSNYAAILSQVAHQYQQALTLFQDVAAFFSSQDTPQGRLRVARARRNMGACYAALKQRQEAKECYQKALSYYEKEGRDDQDYPKTIVRIGDMERYMKDYPSAITHYRQAMALLKTMGMMEEYNSAGLSLQRCYMATGQQQQVELMEQEGEAQQQARLDRLIADSKANLEVNRLYMGPTVYASSLGVIGGSYLMKGELDSAASYMRQHIEQEREALRSEFRLKSEVERMVFWNEEKTNISEIMQLLMAVRQAARPDLQSGRKPQLLGDVAAVAYDAQLLSKGILLRSSIELEKILQLKGDTAVINLYNQTKAQEEQISRLRVEAQSPADLASIVALSQQNRALQLKLYQACAEVADFTDYLAYDWRDVQRAMSPKDVAIEFSSISDFGAWENQMVALVLTKEMKTPVPVVLWDNSRLEECDETAEFAALRDSIFRHHMNDFIRKSDTTHTLAGMTGPGISMQFLQDLQASVSQSATPYQCELTLYLQHLMAQYAKADSISAPIGLQFIRYDRLIEENDAIFTQPQASNLIWGQLQPYLKGKRRLFFAADGCLNRIGIEYLPLGGKPLSEQMEVYRLSSTKELCYKHESRRPAKVALFGDINYNDQATHSANTQRSLTALRAAADEGDFADLSNTRREMDGILSILKTAKVTDAESFRDTEASKTAFMTLNGSSVNLLHIATHGMYREKSQATDAESMQNSLLAFAGANLDSLNLVSAAEIAQMNLRQCDLAVLSACETGLGKLGGDGVFGLQRGFKNAGVNTLLMSLKNVYDDSTADLMICFYRHLMSGLSKREALVRAQQDLRAKGFSDPRHWAVFILLDALD